MMFARVLISYHIILLLCSLGMRWIFGMYRVEEWGETGEKKCARGNANVVGAVPFVLRLIRKRKEEKTPLGKA